MEINTDNVIPFRAVHPGSLLKSEIQDRGINQKEFAIKLGVSPSLLNEVIKGKRAISNDLALKLSDVLDMPAKVWARLQADYDLTLAEIGKRDEKERLAQSTLQLFGQIIDLPTIKKAYGITSNNPCEYLEWFKNTFNVDSPSDLNFSFAGLFRKSSLLNNEEQMIRTWVLIAKERASRITVSGVFDHDKSETIAQGLSEILHENHDTINTVTVFLSNNGIRFCIVDKIKGAPIDGYSDIVSGVPTIVLTKRIDRIDNFAFSLMHEFGHISLHHSPGAMNARVTFQDRDDSREEKEADAFASSHLIPNSLWKSAPETRPYPPAIQQKYSAWAEQHGLNKWIVLGRISYESGVWAFKRDESSKVN